MGLPQARHDWRYRNNTVAPTRRTRRNPRDDEHLEGRPRNRGWDMVVLVRVVAFG
jgi:hypothetical protein